MISVNTVNDISNVAVVQHLQVCLLLQLNVFFLASHLDIVVVKKLLKER